MWTSALFGAKKLWVFRYLWCVRMDKRGKEVELVRTFRGQEEGEIFRGSLLWTASYLCFGTKKHVVEKCCTTTYLHIFNTFIFLLKKGIN